MKNLLKCTLSILLALTFVFSSAYVGLRGVDFSSAFVIKTKAAASGSCGENLTWTFDNKGTLTISGTGDMYDADYIWLDEEETEVFGMPWYEHEKSIKKVIIEDGVISIGYGAFSGCSNLTSVIIPDSVMYIYSYAFFDCEKLASIKIPDSVIYLGENILLGTAYFENPKNWEAGVLYINDYLITANEYDNAKGEYIGKVEGDYEIKQGTKLISEAAFAGCKKLTSINIPDSVIGICDYAFGDCGITSINIPDSITSVGSSAFKECKSLKSVYITDLKNWCNISFSSYASNPLYNGAKLYINGKFSKDIVIPDGVNKIGDYVFAGYASLTSIKIPDSVTYIGEGVLAGTQYYKNTKNWENGVLYINDCLIAANKAKIDEYYISGYIGNVEGAYVIKAGTKLIAASAFEYCGKLTAITIPDSLTSIGNSAFLGCTKLDSITIPNSVKSIGDYAFYGCESLNSIKVSDSVTSIGYSAFYGCTSLTSIAIPASVTSIGASAFENCTKLKSVKIPDSVTSIGASAFKFCEKLTSITIPNSVTNIGKGVFEFCTNLISVSIGNSLKTISNYAFHCCENLTSIIIPASVKSIGDFALAGCTKLKSVKIPTSVISIGLGAFCECVNLTDVYYGGSIKSWKSIKKGVSNETLINARKHYAIATKPGNPKIQSISNTVSGVKLKWSMVDGADSYNVYRQVGSGSWKLIAKDVASTTYTDKTVTSGTIYRYKARAYNKAGLSDNHNNFSTIKYFAAPKVSKVANAIDGIRLQWNSVKGATKYHIYRKTPNGDFVHIRSVTSTTYLDTTVKNKSGNVYWYTVKATDGKYTGDCYKYGSPYVIKAKRLSTPKVSQVGNVAGGIEVCWNKIGGAKGYNVYRRTGKSEWKYIAKTTSTKFVDKTVKNSAGKVYQYTVRATYESFISSFYDTNIPEIKRLLAPNLSSAKSLKSGITLKWNKVTGAQGYVVYRKAGNGKLVKLATVKGISKISYTDKSAKKGTKYTYQIKAYSGKTYSAYSNSKTLKDSY